MGVAPSREELVVPSLDELLAATNAEFVRRDTNISCAPVAGGSVVCTRGRVSLKLSEERFGDLAKFVRQAKTVESSESEDIINALRLSSPVDERECCVCLERSSDLVLPCLHNFCKPCLAEWIAKSLSANSPISCPVCRAPLRPDAADDAWLLVEPIADETFFWTEIERLSKLS